MMLVVDFLHLLVCIRHGIAHIKEEAALAVFLQGSPSLGMLQFFNLAFDHLLDHNELVEFLTYESD